MNFETDTHAANFLSIFEKPGNFDGRELAKLWGDTWARPCLLYNNILLAVILKIRQIAFLPSYRHA